jgi:hypothetical protein
MPSSKSEQLSEKNLEFQAEIIKGLKNEINTKKKTEKITQFSIQERSSHPTRKMNLKVDSEKICIHHEDGRENIIFYMIVK